MHPPGASVVEYYGMKDGSVVYYGQLYYTPDTWCSVYDFGRALEKILDDVKGVKVIYVSGQVPKELVGSLPHKISVVRTPLPADP